MDCTSIFTEVTAFLFYLIHTDGVFGNYEVPLGIWPLTEESRGVDVSASKNDAIVSDCTFGSGDSDVLSTSLQLDGGTFVEINNINGYFSGDFMLSALFYPSTSRFTLFHYVDASGKDIFKVWYDGSKIKASVTNSTGAVLASASEGYTLSENAWHHIGFLRDRPNGGIKLFCGTEKVIDIDDSFPDDIGLATGGTLRVGKPFDHTMDTFVGRLGCLQVFTDLISEGEMDTTVLDTCRRPQWISTLNGSPEVTCRSSLTTAIQTTTTETPTDAQTPAERTSPSTIPDQAGSLDPTNGYFLLRARMSVPSASASLLEVTVTRSRRECAAGCTVRPDCLSFAALKVNTLHVNCSLYDIRANTFDQMGNYMYYIRVVLA